MTERLLQISAGRGDGERSHIQGALRSGPRQSASGLVVETLPIALGSAVLDEPLKKNLGYMRLVCVLDMWTFCCFVRMRLRRT